MGLWKQTRELGPRTCAKQKWATKLVEILCPKGTFWRFIAGDSKGENNAFPSPPPPYNVVPLFELPIENNKHPRGQGRGVDGLAYSNTISPRFCRQFEFLAQMKRCFNVKNVLMLKKRNVLWNIVSLYKPIFLIFYCVYCLSLSTFYFLPVYHF